METVARRRDKGPKPDRGHNPPRIRAEGGKPATRGLIQAISPAPTPPATPDKWTIPDARLQPGSSVALCSACGQYFKSASGFTKHRVGDLPERRCWTPTEMEAHGMSRNAKGLWITAVFDRPLDSVPEEESE